MLEGCLVHLTRTARIVARNLHLFKTLCDNCNPSYTLILHDLDAASDSLVKIPKIQAGTALIRKLKTGKYRLYSRKKDPKTGKRRNLGTFDTKEAAKKHERAVQFFKRA